jgi:hypothetical protein
MHQPPLSPAAHLHHPHQRILDLLDALKHEIDVLNEESAFSKHHRSDLEAKRIYILI